MISAMSSAPHLLKANEALDACDVALVKLEKTCCVPGRSPSMQALADSFTEIRGTLDAAMGSDEGSDKVVIELEGVGAQVGKLQVTCCAPSRSRHYAAILAGLTQVQRALAASRGQGH